MTKIEALVNGEVPTARKVKLAKAEYARFMSYVEDKARNRKKMLGKLDDGDFFSGAMSAMYALEMQPPASWVFGIMCNRPELYGMEEKSGKRTTKV